MKNNEPLKVMAVVGSLNRTSITRVVVQHVAAEMTNAGCAVDLLDFFQEPLTLFNPESSRGLETFSSLQERVVRADVYLLGTPDYHGGISSAMKNFLDHFWHEFAGKLFGIVVASHEKGLTVIDQVRTVARQCYAWTLPYGVSFMDKVDVVDGQVASEPLKQRLQILGRDLRVYGQLLARQRAADLAGADPGFLARYR